MSDKEFFYRELESLKEADQEKVAEYIKFLKVKNIFSPEGNVNEKTLHSLENKPARKNNSAKSHEDFYPYSI
jgi:hypothetical protein